MATEGLSLPKDHGVVCWVCHYHKEARLHENYPVDIGEFGEANEAQIKLQNAEAYLSSFGIDREEPNPNVKYHLEYTQKGSVTQLKQHCEKYHKDVLLEMGHGSITSASQAPPQRQGSQASHRTLSHTIENHYRSVKKLKKNSVRQTNFVKLLTLVIVFCRLSFSILENAWFKFFVYFLDPSVTVPNRKTFTTEILPAAVASTKVQVKKQIEKVYGVCLMFDLWMSRKSVILQHEAPTCISGCTQSVWSH